MFVAGPVIWGLHHYATTAYVKGFLASEIPTQTDMDVVVNFSITWTGIEAQESQTSEGMQGFP